MTTMTAAAPPHPKANPLGYYRAILRYCSGQTRLQYPGAPEPLGAEFMLHRADADRIATEVFEAMQLCGGKPLPVCREMRPMDEARLVNAYLRRGLIA